MTWREYLAQVRTWKNVRPSDLERATFYGNALDAGQTLDMAILGWALFLKNNGLPQRVHFPARGHRGHARGRRFDTRAHRGRVSLLGRRRFDKISRHAALVSYGLYDDPDTGWRGRVTRRKEG